MHTIFKSVLCGLITFLYLRLLCQASVISDAAYHISNDRHNLCLTAGNITAPIPGALAVLANITTTKCNFSSRNQQWIPRYYDEHNKTFTISNMKPVKYHMHAMNLNLSGDFIHYFPHPIKILRINRRGSLIKDTASGKCYACDGENRTMSLVHCHPALPPMVWNFTIVNELNLPPVVCKKFWDCSYATPVN